MRQKKEQIWKPWGQKILNSEKTRRAGTKRERRVARPNKSRLNDVTNVVISQQLMSTTNCQQLMLFCAKSCAGDWD